MRRRDFPRVIGFTVWMFVIVFSPKSHERIGRFKEILLIFGYLGYQLLIFADIAHRNGTQDEDSFNSIKMINATACRKIARVSTLSLDRF